MSKFLMLGLALALAGPATDLPPPPGGSSSHATTFPAEDARCDTCDALDLLQQGDYRRGHHILEMRAAEGDAFAVTGLGMMYQNGWGVPVDYNRAMGFYQTAAREGEPLALNQIGFMFLRGLGRPADPKSAWCWFDQAAERGLDKSAHHLAELMAAGMQPVSCKPPGAKTSSAADRRQDQGGAPATPLELWNGVREGMTPAQVASVLPAPYHWADPPAGPIGDQPTSDAVLAPAALFGHPAIAKVLFVNHAAKVVNLDIDPPSDDPEQNLSLARALISRFDAVYGHTFQVTDQGGGVSAIWRRGGLTIDLEYLTLPDQAPTFMVVFRQEVPADRRVPSYGAALPAPGFGGT